MKRVELLERQTQLAFCQDPEMSLLASIEGLGDDVMGLRISNDAWTIGEILYHVASCKIRYCQEGWGKWSGTIERPLNDLRAMRALLTRANQHMIECLQTLRDDDLDRPLPLSFHGESASLFFSVMIIHDASHAAQIRAILRHCGKRTGGYYPVV